jgi:hypothetical protein
MQNEPPQDWQHTIIKDQIRSQKAYALPGRSVRKIENT